MLELGYATYGMPDADPDDAVPRLVDVGYDAVELCASDGWPTSHDNLDDEDRAGLVDLYRDLDLPPPHVMDLSLRPCATGDGEPTRERFRATCALARDLTWEGAAVVKTTVPGEPDDWADDQIVSDLAEFADIAAEHDAILAVEPHVGTPIDTPGKAATLMERTAHPNLGLAFDVSHFPPALFDVERAVELCAPHAVTTHVKDTVVEDGDVRFRLPGETGFDYRSYLRSLVEQGYAGPITVEVSAQLWDAPGYDAWEAARTAYGALREPVAAANERAG